jgi:hypothetical protein
VSSGKPFEGWAILELMGHRKLAGILSEEEVAGAAMLRIDVPGEGETIVATQFYAAAAIYAITPVTEEIARAVAQSYQPAPVTRWELKSIEAGTIRAPAGEDEDAPWNEGDSAF